MITKAILQVVFPGAEPQGGMDMWHGWLYGLLRHPLTDAKARAYHEGQKEQSPFRIGVYPGREKGQYRVTVTLLAPELLAALAAGFHRGARLDMNGARGQIRSVAWCEAEDGEAGSVSWDAMEEAGTPAASVTLEFLTPTTFRQGDNQRRPWLLPIPDPDSITRSLERQWTTWAGRLPSGWSPDCTPVAVTAADIRTERILVKGVWLIGFVGRVTLSLVDGTTEQKAGFMALVRAASYTGIGAKTAFGLGQVRVCELKGVGLPQIAAQ